ncbi:LOW QUALITY PROTEIN: uncharacterized protein LOC119578175 [Penaeus monodon]|uniref:LOW QUALITY PROTEIN: uncharacterized protein LOC119578175 n=1 Tax=Penaeus monodon TaxID=6687 RepID=UPI0018A7C866|nr:LOW QUALITY PROTEIN: uncharacterized protein LOC119578175 [Penaeus monodon]
MSLLALASKAKLFLCELCGMKLSTREARRRHILAKHIKERKNFCKTCGKAFIFKFALKAHKAVHSDNPRFNCVCGMSFSVRASYMDHIKRIHTTRACLRYHFKLLFSPYCTDRQTLRIHLISVHKPKTISCTQKGCTKVFSTVGLMRNHYRYHLNRKFTCDECGRSFSTESYMYKHRLTHSGIRPHVCVDCGKTYLSASHLSKHRRMAHSTARPFQCSFCGKCYKTKDQVNYHESSHRGEKPFQCEVCGYATSYRNTYYAHRKKHFVKSSQDCTVSGAQKSSLDIQSDSSEVESSKCDDVPGKGKKISDSPRCKGKSKDLSKTKNSNTHKKGDITIITGSSTGLVDASEDSVHLSETSPEQLSLQASDNRDIFKVKNVCSPNAESVEVIYVSPRSSAIRKMEQQPSLTVPHGNDQNITVYMSSGDSQKVDAEKCYLSCPAESPITQKKGQENEDSFKEAIQICGSQSTAADKCTGEKNMIMAGEKLNSCIILSSNGKCAVPTCESNDDSLLLIRVGDDSYIGVCRHHTFTDQLCDTPKDGDSARESNEVDFSLQAYDNVSIHITTHTEREGDEIITFATSDASLKTSGELDSVGELEAEIEDQTISLITLPEKYERVEIDTEDSLPHQPELGVELLKSQSIAHVEQPDANEQVRLSSNEVCPVEDFSPMIELDSGVASLSGHIVDDSLSLAQLEVICPLCDEQFMCMDAYVTHLECSHN